MSYSVQNGETCTLHLSHPKGQSKSSAKWTNSRSQPVPWSSYRIIKLYTESVQRTQQHKCLFPFVSGCDFYTMALQDIIIKNVTFPIIWWLISKGKKLKKLFKVMYSITPWSKTSSWKLKWIRYACNQVDMFDVPVFWPSPREPACTHIHKRKNTESAWIRTFHSPVSVFMFVLSSPKLSNCCDYAVGIITASLANNDNGAGDYQGTRKKRWRGERAVWISLDHKRLYNSAC